MFSAVQVFTRLDSCSSADILNEADTVNRNARILDGKECSDDDNLDTLDRKVSAIVNANIYTDVLNTDNGNMTEDILRIHKQEIIFRQHSSETNHSTDSVEDVCESWSDEEGEEPGDYNQSLRRRRYVIY